MVNTIGGKNYKKGKKGGRATKNPSKEFDTENGIFYYAQVKSKLGGNTLDVLLQTGESVHATIPGRFLRRVWFNKDDLIVVSNDTGSFYDVVQKITNPATLAEANLALNIKLDKDNAQMFRADIDDIVDEEDDEPTVPDKDVSKAELNAMRKKKDKERDLKRREGDDEDREISVVTNNHDDDSDSDKETLSSKSSSTKSSSTKSSSTKSSSTKSSSVKSSPSETESDSDSDFELPPLPAKKAVQTTAPVASFLKKQEPDKKEKVTTPDKSKTPTKKVVEHKDTPEQVADMLGL
jgi:translation initiation factor IF-1